VKNWLRNQQQTENIARGKAILDKESKRLGIKVLNMDDMLSHFKHSDTDSLLEAIGRGDINSRQLAGFLKIPELDDVPINVPLKKPSTKSVVTVADIDNVQTSFAHCCSPVLGDDIIGYISHHKGITVHRTDCKNITHLSIEKRDQLISVTWGAKKSSHAVPIVIHAFNAQNLLINVSQILAQSKIHIFNAALDTHPDFSAILNLTIQIESTHQLSQVLSKINQLPNIVEVRRKT
jgi:GTP pyrophosphokinase